MKRFFALAALVLGLASCQTEPEGLDVQMGGAVDATITVNIPDSETRAGGTNSAGSIFDNVDLGTEDDAKTMRYILMIYDANGVASKDRKVEYSDGKTVNFDVRLVPGRHYSFVVWADYVESKNDTDFHYNTKNEDGLKNITLNDTWVAMDETRDAFTGVFNTKVDGNMTEYNGAKDINITLTRPFAKLRVVTTDLKELTDLSIVPNNAEVTYTTAFHESFDALNGTYGPETVAKTHTYEIANYADNTTTNKVLFTDYFFADDSDVVKFTMDVKEANGQSIKYNTFNTDIAVKRNHLTTISGNILTDGNKVNVTVEDTFGENNNQHIDYNTISSDVEFLAAVNTPGKYVVISNLHIANEGDTVTTLATRAGGATTTIDLNGKTITVDNKGTGALASVATGNTLIITDTVGEGAIVLTEDSTGAFIENNGTLTIEGGAIESHNTAANNAPSVIENNGTTNISGGVIGNNAVENSENGDVNITGGTFTSDELLNDYVNDDYQAIEGENGEITIEKKPTIAKIGDNEYTSLIKAVAAVQDGETITLDANEVFTTNNRYNNSGYWDGLGYSGDKSFTIDLNSKTICQEDGALNDYLIWIKNDGSKANTITLKNGTLDAGTTAYCAFATASSNKQKITINLENVNLIGNNSNGAVAKIRGGAELNVKTGTVITGNDNYVGIESVGSATVVNIYEGAKINQKGTTSYWGSLAGVSYGSTLNVYGGEGTSKKGGFIAMTSGGTINVYGGEWIANTDGTYANDNNSVLIAQSDKKYNAGAGDSVINVTGGTFKGGYNCYGNAVGDAQINIKGGNFNANPTSYLAEGCEANEANGIWTVRVIPVAKIGETEYETFEAAVAAAEAGNTITLTRDVTLAEELEIPANVTINGNGKQINGSIYAGGNLTFAGHTKVTAFSASYYDRVITIGEGACLEVTGGGRVSLAYGNTFNITGSIEDAKTADKANIQPSLIIPAGISITGGSDATMNVTNAYIKIGDTSSKNSSANGTFSLNINNSIIECTKGLTFAEPTEGKNPTFNVNITNSVLTTGTKLILAAPGCEMNVDNSTINISTYFGNSGVVTLTNGSELTGSSIQDNEGINHRGSTTVDNSTFTVNATSTGHAFNGRGTGSITAQNGANVTVTYYKGITITTDATSTFTGTDVDANKKIYYVSDEMALEPTNPDALGGAVVVSNVWDSKTGKGVITFDRDLTTIGEKAFQRVTNTTPSNWATSITLPNSVKTIGDYAFAQCYNLTNIVIPDGVTSIGQYAFQSCNAVTTVTIGSNVTTIDSGAFYNCYEIAEIICKPTTPPTLADKWVFNGVETNSVNVFVPTAAVNDYKTAWSVFTNIEGREF